MRIEIKSPLVSISFEDDVVQNRDGYIKHDVPGTDEVIAIIEQMKDSAIEVIDRVIIASLKGGIDLKKLEEFKQFEEIIEKSSK